MVQSVSLLRLAVLGALAFVVITCGESASTVSPTGPTAKTVASVSVTTPSHTLKAIGATQQFTAVAKAADGSTVSGKTFVWTSSDTTVAKVNSSGQVTAVANGSADILAAVDGKSGSAALTVAQAAASIAVSSSRDTLIIIGDTVTFSAALTDSRGNSVSGKTPTWTSSAPAVVRVNAAGLATAVRAGTASIIATADTVRGSRILVVRPTPVAVLDMPDSADAGGQVTVSLRLLTDGVAQSTGALVATLSWDPAVLQFNAANAAAIPYFMGYYNNAQGQTRIVVSEPSGIAGNFSAVAFVFDVVGVSGAASSLSVSLDQLIAARIFTDFTSGAVGADRVLIIR